MYEKTAQLRERGAAILLWPNATRILRDLGILDALVAQSDPVTHCEIRSWKGRPIKRWKVPELSTPAIFIHRADLQSTLLETIPRDRVHLGEGLEGFERNESKVVVNLSSGRTAEGDALIGADGLRSKTRELLFGKSSPVYQGYTQWTGLLSSVHSLLKPGLKMEWWGNGVRFGIAANGKGRMNWYLSVNRASPEAPDSIDLGFLLEQVRRWQEPVEEILRSTPKEAIIPINIWAIPSFESWGAGSVTLLGDAAHPTSPNLGQGAGMAIEDAACLAMCLKESENVSASLRRYENLRKRRTAATTKNSGFVGRMAQWSHPALVAARTAFLRTFPLPLWERQLKRLYSYRVEEWP